MERLRFNDVPTADQLATNRPKKKSNWVPEEIFENAKLSAFEEYMTDAIKDAIAYLGSHDTLRAHVRVNFHDRIVFTVPGIEREFTMTMHTGLYGIQQDMDWCCRQSQTRCVFKELQAELYEKGYVLLDESDPNRSYREFINIYIGIPSHYDKAPIYWHGLNKLPFDINM